MAPLRTAGAGCSSWQDLTHKPGGESVDGEGDGFPGRAPHGGGVAQGRPGDLHVQGGADQHGIVPLAHRVAQCRWEKVQGEQRLVQRGRDVLLASHPLALHERQGGADDPEEHGA